MAKHAQKEKDPSPAREFDYHEAAQLSALRALSLCFSGRPSSYFRHFAETFLEYVVQVFEADGGYLEFSSPSSSGKISLAIGSFQGQEEWRKRLSSEVKEPGRIHHLQMSSLLSKPISLEKRTSGMLVLGKSKTPSFFRERDLEELEFFTHYFALASKKASAKKTREEAIRAFSENLEDGVYVVDRKGRPIVMNPKGKLLLGVYAIEDAIHG